MSKRYVRFQSFHKTLDALFNHLHSDGVGRQVKKAEIITPDKEQMLWDSGVLNTSTPKGLLSTSVERCSACEVGRSTEI